MKIFNPNFTPQIKEQSKTKKESLNTSRCKVPLHTKQLHHWPHTHKNQQSWKNFINNLDHKTNKRKFRRTL